MPYTALSLGLTLQIPAPGTKGWGPTALSSTWSPISRHRHEGSGDGNQIRTAGLTDGAVTTVKLSPNIGVTQVAIALSAGANSVDWNLGNVKKATMPNAATATLSFQNALSGSSYKLILIQGTGNGLITWPANVKFKQATPPTLSTAAGKVDIVNLYFDGTNFYADWDTNYA